MGGWPLLVRTSLTTASSEDDIVPASPVDLIGRVTSDVTVLKGTTDPGRVIVEKGM